MTTLLDETLTRSIIGGFYEVYNTLGYGFLEHPFVLAVEQELQLGFLLHFSPEAKFYRVVSTHK